MSPNRRYSLFVIGMFALVSACNHRSGSSSFEFVDRQHPETAADAGKLDITKRIDVFLQAKPELPLIAPIYPKAALKAKVGTATITVSIAIGKDGRVGGVKPIMEAIRIPTRFDEDFDQAIRVAVAQWQFEPAKVAHIGPSTNGPIVTDSAEVVETSLDVVFVFSQAGTVGYSVPK
jgi:hypothetical protein